jgi:mannose/cellobiose epimerase-like protein (N-acyl-D-glucosamine 2-epimerase family)
MSAGDRLAARCADSTLHKTPLYGRLRFMSATPRKTLLEPGHEAEWAELNREKREHHQRAALAMTPSERIAEGQKLSQQAVSLLAASIRAGHAPRRAFWS